MTANHGRVADEIRAAHRREMIGVIVVFLGREGPAQRQSQLPEGKRHRDAHSVGDHQEPADRRELKQISQHRTCVQ